MGGEGFIEQCWQWTSAKINRFKTSYMFLIHSTFGVTGNQWRYAAKATVTTMVSSFGGGIVSLVMSFFIFDGKIDVLACVNGVLGALVGITGKC